MSTPPQPPSANLDAVARDLATRYLEVRRLGDGAEGGTFAAREPGGARVVCKPVPTACVGSVQQAFALLRAAASPHLPAPRELWAGPSGTTWMVTDWIEGAPLAAEPVAVPQALAEVLAVARALAVIHRAGTHHGDVSLGNILLTPTRACVLVDLAQLGRVGSGTPGFLAPEVLAGGGGPAADWFALGCVAVARLLGAVPWRRPDVVARLRPDDVRAALAALGADGLPPSVVETLAILLHPDPARRPHDAGALVHRLEQLQWLARADAPAPPSATWRLPSRTVYRGTDPQPVLALLRRAEPPRLVVVVGPPHGGRRRLVEELVQQLQLGQRDARLGEAPGSDDEAWIERWLAAPRGAVLGWRTPLGDAAMPERVARCAAAAALASGTAIVAASDAFGAAIEATGSAAIRVVRTRAWTRAELAQTVAEAFDGESAAIVDALLEHGGGWPGRSVQAIAALAAAREPLLDRSAIERALQHVHEAALPRAQAEVVLRAWWSGAASDLAAVPSHLHDGDRPLGSALAAARQGLHDGVIALARERLAAGERGLAVAIDADDASAVETRVGASPPAAGTPEAAALVAWVERAPAERASGSVAVATRLLLAAGAAERALALVRARTEPALVLESARALQRLGRAEEALAQVAAAQPGDDDLALQLDGLALRLLVDLGRLEQAHARARALSPAAQGLGAATASLWAGYVELARGDRDAAARTLSRVGPALAGLDDVRAQGVRARAVQLRGNLALERGELEAAAAAWSEAASAFRGAGEPVGALTLSGSLAGLAVQSFAPTGLAQGRTALRGLLARGHNDALATAAVNLAQLLSRHGEHDELAVLCRSVTAAMGPWAPAAARARTDRVAAEHAWAQACTRGRDASAWLEARAAFDRAARSLTQAGLHAEASEAWARGCGCARAGGRLDVAQADLAAAAQAAERAGEQRPWRVQLERLELLAARGELERAGGETGELALEQLDGLCARGAFDHAWARARAAWSVACARLGRGHAVRRRVAQRLLQLQEVIMDKTNANDRNSVRAALWADGERTALRELANEVGEAAPVAAAPAQPRAPESDGHTERLLRLHRRLAREDRLEPLLEQVIDAVMELTDAERGAIVVLARDGGRREVTRELGGGAHAVEFSRSVIDRVLAGGEPVLSVDAAADDRFDGSRSISHLNLRSVLAVPLWFRGELVGAIYVDHRLRRGNFVERDLGQVEEFAELAALAIAHARVLAEVRAQAAQLAAQHEQLGALLEAREVEVVGLRQRVADSDPGGARHGMVGSSAAMQRVYKLVDRLGDTDVPVVIYGESGTGKELVARAVHRAGARASKPFVAENCGAIPETLLESVLFGHAKGAFTGADKARPGLFEAAHGGTIFLDEVGETSAAMQTKLLRVLQEGEVRRVGENAARPVDVRVIAASNRDLEAMVEQGKFRRDLYYRIHVVRLELPPLRARTDDLPALVEHFLARPGGARLSVVPATMRALAAYAWPGNVRELENEVQRWIALCDGAVTPEDLSPALRGREPAVDPDDLRIRPRVDRLERELIARALERARGNQTRAAELLGLSRFGLQKKLRKLAEGAGGGEDLGEGDEG